MNEKLSAFMDNELDELETRRLLATLAEDEALRAAWGRYHLAGAVLRRRLDQIGINADAKDVILDAAKQNDDFSNAREGNVPLAQVESLSGASGVPSEVLTGNDGLGRLMHNDAVVRTWLQAFHQATDEIAAHIVNMQRAIAEPDAFTRPAAGTPTPDSTPDPYAVDEWMDDRAAAAFRAQIGRAHV